MAERPLSPEGEPMAPICAGCGTVLAPTARFCSECGLRQPGAAAPRLGAPRSRELRPMTVMFCDVVGSAALAAGRDPEEFTEAIARFYRLTAEVVLRHGGHLGRLVGDGVMVHFGYPAAQEDDAERAVRAALGILDAVALAAPGRAGPRLAVRIGISTGLVVVADVADTGDPRNLDVFGETPNLAARLQALAQPGTVLVSDSVRRLVGALFEFRSLGAHPVKGWPEPMPVWQALGVAASPDRFAARAEGATLPLVGRDAALERLRCLWRAAQIGEGRTVLVSGEAGIGKSRLVAQLLRETQGQGRVAVRYFAAPHQQGMPLQPVLQQLERDSRMQRGETPAERIAKLRALLPDLPPVDLALVAEQLSLSGPDLPPVPPMPPQRRRERLLLALMEGLVAVTRARPVLMVLEDAHWADPTTRELLAQWIERVPHLPVLAVVTARPEFLPPWLGAPGVERLNLAPLGEAEAAELVRNVARDVPLPPEAARDILRRADGVPLFLEELTRAVAEQIAQAGGGPEPARRRGGDRTSVPVSLHASLLARLDRLGEAREVAEVASVIGREFDPALLALVLERDAASLEPVLARLVESRLLQRHGQAPGGTYRFRHALVQDAAMGLLPRERYRDLHARVADILEARFPEAAEARPQVIAHHRAEAMQPEQAVACWLRGAQQAIRRGAMEEALVQLRRGIALLQGLPESEAHDGAELDMQLLAGNALLALRGHGALETGQAYDRARVLAERLPGQPQLRNAMHGQWSHAWMRGAVGLAMQRAEALLAHAAARDSSGGLAIAWSALGHSQFLMGRYREAMASLDLARQQDARPERDRRYGLAAQVTVISTRCYAAWARAFTGRLGEARRDLVATLAAAEASRFPFAIAYGHYALGRFDYDGGSAEACIARLRQAIAFCEEHEIGYLAMASRALVGVLLGEQGDAAAGLELVRDCIRWNREAEALAFVSGFLGMEAELMARAGDTARALERIEEGLALMADCGTAWEQPTLLRRRGGIHRRAGRMEAAEADLRAAVALAEAQGAGLFRLQAAMPLAGLLAGTGRGGEGHGLLAAALAPLDGEVEPVVLRARDLLARPEQIAAEWKRSQA
ncbi:AAA family ATPase [Paracraurococcus lichenis]|uniref:Adenylate/guanylate cyclase domain-containing protein n=1 Tax=Paracraurococcus lichenis TaxID=3064888 RepID=A0ABT9DUW3_9PROT|nr:AAA family ATPase [Paracraurococcus sp. LOR1-02]MDO9707687.1 adenylate/guanylate cyclase domain-containing protein [Paracraurococcus sp. LOR1-02]